jgi:hypothetical protein
MDSLSANPSVEANGPGVPPLDPHASSFRDAPLVRGRGTRELFRRWPNVPSRELAHIRRVLLLCLRRPHSPGSPDELSEPARALLQLVTGELRRRHPGATALFDGDPPPGHDNSSQQQNTASLEGRQ